MRFLVATENGKLSYIKAAIGSDASDKNSNTSETAVIHSSTAGSRIKCMAKLSFPSPSRGDVEAAAIACKDGTVLLLDAQIGEVLAKIEAPVSMLNAGKTPAEIVSLEIQHGYLATCTTCGHARFTKLSSLWSDKQMTFDAVLPSPIDVMRLHPKEAGTIAFGGRENDLQVWSTKDEHGGVDTQVEPFANLIPRWVARNVKNDKLDLRVPIWITDLQFLSSPFETIYKVVTATHHKQLRVYDTDKARRPVSSLELSENAISRMVDVSTEEQAEQSKVVFADSVGNVMHADLDKGLVIGAYKGFSGAVGSLAVSANEKTLAAGGMDSYLRAFSVDGHQQLLSVYVGSRINHILILDEEAEIKEEEGDEDEDEDVWDALEQANEPQSKRARRA